MPYFPCIKYLLVFTLRLLQFNGTLASRLRYKNNDYFKRFHTEI